MPDCKTCKEKKKEIEPVSYYVHESDMARMERSNKRLWIALLVSIIIIVASNGFWIYRESQFETVTTTTTTVEQELMSRIPF